MNQPAKKTFLKRTNIKFLLKIFFVIEWPKPTIINDFSVQMEI